MSQRRDTTRCGLLLTLSAASTAAFCTLWQFSPFVMVVQTLATLLTFLAHSLTPAAATAILYADLGGFLVATALLCGNTIYTGGLFLPLCGVGLLLVRYAPRPAQPPPCHKPADVGVCLQKLARYVGLCTGWLVG